MGQMLAARLNVRTHELRMAQVPVPEPGRGQVRVQVAAAGVCLSDVHLVDGTLNPMYLDGEEVTLGHEVAGTIDRLGADVQGWKVGQRVLLQAGEEDAAGRVWTRGVDYDGGYAEYCLATQETLVAIPDRLPFEQACIIPDAVSTPWAAITTSGQIRPAEPVAVWGLGGLGTHAVQLLRLIGAAPIVAIDPVPEARERAAQLGADATLDPTDSTFTESLFQVVGPSGLAAAFDFAGVPSVREQALGVLGSGGRLVITGLANQPISIDNDLLFAYQKQSVRGHYGSQPEDVTQLVALTGHDRLELSQSVSGVFSLQEAPQVIHRLENKEGNPIRLVLTPRR
ncbi:zinc-binding dehydrogenase [Lipingzhangella sp. LS1_29]|uniref:Zinc-binding dehydrogenase n=1 Tax=Lipingzhangella rawalii TaxID=2055835 RepID=A0ABU2H6I1_9ACTN|nr:zinc-binding dehydrogenase [Lipingzhangella rawalii]MDS1270891.1 zinc-binding dehydrogenase [Lipingzhangella rawalii]